MDSIKSILYFIEMLQKIVTAVFFFHRNFSTNDCNVTKKLHLKHAMAFGTDLLCKVRKLESTLDFSDCIHISYLKAERRV